MRAFRRQRGPRARRDSVIRVGIDSRRDGDADRARQRSGWPAAPAAGTGGRGARRATVSFCRHSRRRRDNSITETTTAARCQLDLQDGAWVSCGRRVNRGACRCATRTCADLRCSEAARRAAGRDHRARPGAAPGRQNAAYRERIVQRYDGVELFRVG